MAREDLCQKTLILFFTGRLRNIISLSLKHHDVSVCLMKAFLRCVKGANLSLNVASGVRWLSVAVWTFQLWSRKYLGWFIYFYSKMSWAVFIFTSFICCSRALDCTFTILCCISHKFNRIRSYSAAVKADKCPWRSYLILSHTWKSRIILTRFDLRSR